MLKIQIILVSYQNVRNDVPLTVLEKLFFAKVWIHFDDFGQNLGQFCSCKKATNYVLHFVGHNTCTSKLKNVKIVSNVDLQNKRPFQSPTCRLLFGYFMKYCQMDKCLNIGTYVTREFQMTFQLETLSGGAFRLRQYSIYI